MSAQYGVPPSPVPSYVSLSPEDEGDCMQPERDPQAMEAAENRAAAAPVGEKEEEGEHDYPEEELRSETGHAPGLDSEWEPQTRQYRDPHSHQAASGRRQAADDHREDNCVQRIIATAGDSGRQDRMPSNGYEDARAMPDYNAADFGSHCIAKVPEFRHGMSGSSTWMSYSQAAQEVQGMRPVRALSWIVPVGLFARDSTRFRHWTTPHANPLRASAIASVLSFCFASMSKGFLCAPTT